MKFEDFKNSGIYVTTKQEGPDGWEIITYDDTSVFYDPTKVDEAEILELVEKWKAGDVEPLLSIANMDWDY